MERTPPRLDYSPTESLADKTASVEILHSIERTEATPIFATSAPPRGLSGKICPFAYKLSESDIRHGLLLLLADRLNVVEVIGDDIRRGKIPNVFAEMGIAVEFKHNPAGLGRKAAITAAITTAIVGLGIYFLTR